MMKDDANPGRERKKEIFGLLLLVAVFAFAFSRRLRYPFHHATFDGFNGCYYSIAARNFNKYGFMKLRFALCFEPGPVKKNPFISLNHPPMVSILVALSFRIFGEGEWQARIVPYLFSMLAVIFFYLFALKLFKGSIILAFLCAYLAGSQTIWLCYSDLVEPLGTDLLFIMAFVLWSVSMWEEKGKKRYLLLSNMGLAFGFTLTWATFFVCGLTGLWALLFLKERKLLQRLSFWATGIVCFLLILLWRKYASGAGTSHDLLESAGRWSVMGILLGKGRITLGQAIERVASFHAGFFNKGVIFLGTAGLIVLPALFFLGKLDRKALLILVPFGTGLLQVSAFLQGAYMHDYFQLSFAPAWAFLVSFLAFQCRELVKTITAKTGKKAWVYGYMLLLILIIISSGILNYFDAIRRWEPILPRISEIKEAGRKLKELTLPHETIVTPLPPLFTLAFYADRPFWCAFSNPRNLIDAWKAWGKRPPDFGGVLLDEKRYPEFEKAIKEMRLKGPVRLGPFRFWDANP